MADAILYSAFCLDPKTPDLPPEQLAKLHAFKDALLDAYNNVIVGDNKVDPNIVLPLVCVHAAAWNQINFRDADPQSVQVANQLMEIAQTNADLHIIYKSSRRS